MSTATATDAILQESGTAAALDAVRALAEPVAAAHGVELVDVELVQSHHGRVLRVTIDSLEEVTDPNSPPPGVGIDACVRVSREISAALDASDPVSGKFHLEVSSPGLDRPLKRPRDYRRQVGRLAKVWLSAPAEDGQSVLRGKLLDAAAETFSIEVDGRRHDVRFDAVKKAKLVFEIEKGEKRGQNGRRRQARKR